MNYDIIIAKNNESLVIKVNAFLREKYVGDITHTGEKWEVVGSPGCDVGPGRAGLWFQAVRFVDMLAPK